MEQSDKIKKLMEELDKNQEAIMKSNAEIAVKFFKDSFNNKGFTDDVFVEWEPDKKEKGDQLEKTGKLMNGIKIESVKKDEATIVNDVPYAKFVNDGTVNMVARKFMGESKTLTNKINENIKEQVNKILNIR